MNNMKNQDVASQGVIFYDGLCVLCSREIEHYRNQVGSERFNFIDITHADFDPSKHGVDPYAVHKYMHVKNPDGELHTGVEAFRTIWKELPKYQFLHRWTDNSFAQFFMKLGYSGFVYIRPYLPRKKANCETSPYCEIKK
jgi:predicted DCC family thiol-disulfide oxidoreductase YuxK